MLALYVFPFLFFPPSHHLTFTNVYTLNAFNIIKWQIKLTVFKTRIKEMRHGFSVHLCMRRYHHSLNPVFEKKLEVFTRNWNANKFHMSHSHHIFYKIPSAQRRVLARIMYLEHMRWEKWPYGSDLKTPARHQPGLGFKLKREKLEGHFMLISDLSITNRLNILLWAYHFILPLDNFCGHP